MKVLVIHPIDPTTNFLSSSLVHMKDFTIIRTNLGDSLLKKLIRAHDIIIMMGHGTEDGLIGYDRFMIDSSFVDDLRKKICICIWCYASTFVQKYKLKSPFSTGMFISEVEEAYLEGIPFKKDEIFESNSVFASSYLRGLFASIVDKKFSKEVLKELEGYYETYAWGIKNSQIIKFNIEQFYSNLDKL